MNETPSTRMIYRDLQEIAMRLLELAERYGDGEDGATISIVLTQAGQLCTSARDLTALAHNLIRGEDE